MDGFFKSSGNAAIGFYTADELPFYYSLLDAPEAVLCANYFCSILGPTSPNRFYLMSGTSGGITSNGYCCFGIFDSGEWPIILDLLDEAGVTWRIYNRGGLEDVLTSDVDNVAWFWSRWADDPRTSGTYDEYLLRLRGRHAAGRLVAHPELRGAPRRAPAPRRLGRDAPPAAGHRRAARRLRSGCARRSCSATTSTAASSTTSRRRRSTRTGLASACRSG